MVKLKQLIYSEASRFIIHGLLFVALYTFFASLLMTFAITGEINAYAIMEANNSSLALLTLTLMPLIFAIWGHRTGMMLSDQAKKFVSHQSQFRATNTGLGKNVLVTTGNADQNGDMPIGFNLHECIHQCMTSMVRYVKNKSQILSVNIHSNVPEYVLGDCEPFREAISILLNNAIKYTEKGEISVSAKILGEAQGDILVRIEVTDSGIGISPEQQSQIFDMNNPVAANNDLAVCKALVEELGGKIGVNSKEFLGSAFWFTAIFHKQPIRDIAA